LRAVCWFALVLPVAASAWRLFSAMLYSYGAWFPRRAEPVTFTLFFILPLLLNLFLYVGLWLLFGIRIHGGGRSGWRWWVGGILALPPGWGMAHGVVTALRPGEIVLSTVAYQLVMLLAILPVWVLSGRPRHT
jgi:hypothetical protein